MTTLVLIRHAESLNNAKAIIGGNSKITEKGHALVEKAGKDLYEKYGDNFDFMLISGLLRTNQTAAIINKFLRIDNISYDARLQEKHYGIYENKNLNKYRSDIHLQDYYKPIPGGESDATFALELLRLYVDI